MYNRASTTWIKHLDFILVDLITLIGAFFLAYYTRFQGQNQGQMEDMYRNILVCMCLILFCAAFALNSHHNILRRNMGAEFVSVLLLTGSTFLVTVFVLYAMKYADAYSRLQIGYTALFDLFLDFFARQLWKTLVRKYRILTPDVNKRKVFVLSDRENVLKILGWLKEDTLDHYSVAAVSLSGTEEDTLPEAGDTVPVLPLSSAADYICREWIDEVFVYLPEQSEQARKFQDDCAQMAVTVHNVMDIHGVSDSKQFLERINEKTVLTTAYNYMLASQALVKRAGDILGGIVGSVFALLILLVVGPIIYHKDPGPVLFKQERIGRNGRRFHIYKIRSMYTDAEAKKQQYLSENRVSDGMMFKLDHDPRILPGIGEFIRKTSLDEFPQFFNVLKGEMSLVGTRPPTVDEWEKYKYHHRARLAMRPGITGLWQVSGRSEITDFEDVVRLDTQYIANFSITLDVQILFRTVIILFTGKGAM